MSDDVYVAFLDPTSLEHIPGWPLRNLLSLLRIQVSVYYYFYGNLGE